MSIHINKIQVNLKNVILERLYNYDKDDKFFNQRFIADLRNNPLRVFERLEKSFNRKEDDNDFEFLKNNPEAISIILKNSFLGKLYNDQYNNWFDIEAAYDTVIKKGLKSKAVLEWSMEQHVKMCVENSEDVFDARILAKELKDDISSRIKQYSYCISKSTKNYRDWLEEDYSRKLRMQINKEF